MATQVHPHTPVRVPILQFIAAGAAASLAIFVLCWAGAAIDIVPATHAFISLFTAEPPASVAAVVQGGGWAAAFGGLSAAVLAIALNLFAFLGR